MLSFPVATQDKILKCCSDRHLFTRVVNGLKWLILPILCFLADSCTYITECWSLDAGQNSIGGGRSTETLPALYCRSMGSGNHLNGFVGSRTSHQSRTQRQKTKKFWYLGEVDKEDRGDAIELVDLSSWCSVGLGSQRVAISFCAVGMNNSNLLPVKAMIEITLFYFWQDIEDFMLHV